MRFAAWSRSSGTPRLSSRLLEIVSPVLLVCQSHDLDTELDGVMCMKCHLGEKIGILITILRNRYAHEIHLIGTNSGDPEDASHPKMITTDLVMRGEVAPIAVVVTMDISLVAMDIYDELSTEF